jgi:hypothetical protein
MSEAPGRSQSQRNPVSMFMFCVTRAHWYVARRKQKAGSVEDDSEVSIP